jgi:hypothetical protein
MLQVPHFLLHRSRVMFAGTTGIFLGSLRPGGAIPSTADFPAIRKALARPRF